ncbi:acid protease [Thelephora ganbajun]|uniref:Acid protease n=1 Tax=Thelephora ganbajun TaxID=370292 RepID=A0ACB6ZI31_THEGA|nr:acid protease [Thelephora ganbajun]
MSTSSFKLPLSRVNLHVPPPRTGGSALSAKFAIANHYNSVGGQTFMVILDTGSTDLWVVSSECTEDDCKSVPSYNETTSLFKTNTPFRLNYLMGSVTGEVAFETIMLGNYRISSQVFALANRTIGLYLSDTGHSGILGLAFDSQASIRLTTGQPLIKSLASHLPEESRYFAVGLSRSESGSSFTIGELDPVYANFTEEFTWSDVYVNPGQGQAYDFWKVPLKGISINGTFLEPLTESKVVDSPTPIAVLDTGTTLMLGPTIDVQYFWRTVGESRQNSNGQWQVLCNRGMVVKIVLGGNGIESEYVMHPGDVNWMDGGKEEDASGKWCIGGIQANDDVNSGDWLLGDIFLRNVYTVHKLETPTSPPQLGLLSTVNIEQALSEFWEERGEGRFPPA